jgi:hypothetical protein
MKRTQQHRVAPNILSRAFQWFVPLRKLWTDITYLRFKWRWIYLSIVKDMIAGEILAFWISDIWVLTWHHLTYFSFFQLIHCGWLVCYNLFDKSFKKFSSIAWFAPVKAKGVFFEIVLKVAVMCKIFLMSTQ